MKLYHPKKIPYPKDILPPGPFQNYLTETGARELAARLQLYWHDLGYPLAKFWVEGIGYISYAVKCNLTNGVPPIGDYT